ncbi:MAG: hypothetical protein IT364_24490 [Candidatus Hydrogenedentes bacterium]|nr:hypothetical protein [Candidatus Hydrogenedentota bacterium]
MATSFHKVTNNAASTLAATIDDDDLSLSVASGDGAEFSTALQWLTIGRTSAYAGEIVEASSRSSDALTLAARGEQGTVASGHESGALVECLLTAEHITELQDAVNALEARVQPRHVNDAGMTDVPGVQGEVVFNENDSKFYGCTVGSETAATWVAFH